MIEIKFKKGLKYEISETKVLCIVKSKHKYYASVLDRETLDIDYSNQYVNAKKLNNFTEKYGVKLIFDKED